MTSPNYIIGLIGCGHMGSALQKGWIKSGIANHIHVLDPKSLPSENKVTFYTNTADWACAADTLDALVIAVRPQVLEDACAPLKDTIPSTTLVLSIAAGTSLDTLDDLFSAKPQIVRTMPNLPAMAGHGVIAACTRHTLTSSQKDMANVLLGAVGHTLWIADESMMDAVTAVSGSGPGYIFHFVAALAEAAEKLGFDKDTAMALARGTMTGCGHYLDALPDEDVKTLRDNMLIGGTTEAGLNVLMDGRLQSLMEEAVQAAQKRSRELGKKE